MIDPAPRAVRISIGELEIDGFAPGTRYRVAAALERELTRLVRDHGLPPACVARSVDPPTSLAAAAPRLHAGGPPEWAGAQIAAAVYRSLG